MREAGRKSPPPISGGRNLHTTPPGAREIYYDFSEAAADNTVKNLGTASGADGRIVAGTVDGNPDVYIENGKLVIANEKTAAKDGGYFRLPDDMFAGRTEWSMQFTISNLNFDNQDNGLGFLGFYEKDPALVPIMEDTEIPENDRFTDGVPNNSFGGIFWSWNASIGSYVPYAQITVGNTLDEVRWGGGQSNPFRGTTAVFTLVFKNGALSGYCGGQMIFCTQNGITELISDNFFEKYAFNKIGGYSYSWGRSDTQITIDDFAFYSYALGAAERIAETTAVTELFADLGPDATALTGLSGRARDGAERSAEIAVAEGVDLSAEGRKQYIVWLEGQRTPARLTLLTRRLLDYTGEITVDSTDSLPSEVQVTYSDGGTGVASAVWEDYEFSLGRQTVSGRITDASGRTASATLTVTGIEFEWSRAEALFAEIESAGEDAVRSSYEAVLSALAEEIAALKAYENKPVDAAAAEAYSALLAAWQTEKENLISALPVREALETYAAAERAEQAPEAERLAYTEAYEALEGCLETCESASARDEAIAALQAAFDGLYIDHDLLGFGFSQRNEAGLTDIAFTDQPGAYWGSMSASNPMTGDYDVTFEVNDGMDYVVGDGANLDIIVITQTRYITYRIGKNQTWDADYLTRCFDAYGWTPVTANNVAVDGVFPEVENNGAIWSADAFELLQPFTVRIWRETLGATTATYYFALEQEGTIRHMYYERIDDVTDYRIAFGAVGCTVNIENIKIKALALPFEKSADAEAFYGADGTSAWTEKTDAGYVLPEGETAYADAPLQAADKLYTFDFSPQSGSVLNIGLAQGSGYVFDSLILTFGAEGELFVPRYGLDIGIPGNTSSGDRESFPALEAGKTYRMALLVSAADGRTSVKLYILDGEETVFESENYTFYSEYDFVPALTPENAALTVSAVTAKDVTGVVVRDDVDLSLYSTASVEAYREAVAKVDLGIVALINDTPEQLAEKRQALEEAKALLQLAKIVGVVDEFETIRVKFGAEEVVLPLRVRVEYDNGTTRNVLVTWDTPDTSAAGEQQVRGVVEQPDGSDFYVYYPILVEAREDGGASDGGSGCNGCGSAFSGAEVLSAFALAAVLLKKRRG